jgi:hypothetical protein
MKDIRFIWGLPQEDSFMKLKELITSASILVLPNEDLLFRLEADGSWIATGMVLSQQQVDDNAWHPVAFLSKVLNLVKQNYEIHDTEMLAIIRGLEEWRHYLEGARHPVEIWTNHKNSEYFQVAHKLNCQQARWSLYLSHFDFTLHHNPGRSMGKLDALSRQADHGSRQGDNDNLTLLAPELFQIHALAGIRLEGDERNILQEVQRSLNNDVQEESVAKAARELRKDKGRGTGNTEDMALLFLKEVWKHHGTPWVVVSDRGPQFVAVFTRKLYKLLGIKLALSMAYHPQTDRQTEHVNNQVLEGYLCIFTSR